MKRFSQQLNRVMRAARSAALITGLSLLTAQHLGSNLCSALLFASEPPGVSLLATDHSGATGDSLATVCDDFTSEALLPDCRPPALIGLPSSWAKSFARQADNHRYCRTVQSPGAHCCGGSPLWTVLHQHLFAHASVALC